MKTISSSTIVCPACGAKWKITDHLKHRKFRCAKCSGVIPSVSVSRPVRGGEALVGARPAGFRSVDSERETSTERRPPLRCYVRQHFHAARGRTVWPCCVLVVLLPLLSFLKPLLGITGLGVVVAILAGAALLLLIAYLPPRLYRYYVRGSVVVAEDGASVTAKLAFFLAVLLLGCLPLSVAEMLSPPEGLLARCVPRLQASQLRLVRALEHRSPDASAVRYHVANRPSSPLRTPPTETSAAAEKQSKHTTEREPTLESALAIEHLPLIRSSDLLAYRPGDVTAQRQIGFAVPVEGSRYLFLAPWSDRVDVVEDSHLEFVAGSVQMEDLLREDDAYAEALIWRTAACLSIPQGWCVSLPDGQRQAQVTLPHSTYVRSGAQLHAMRLTPREQYVGVLSVVQAFREQTVVSVPRDVDLRPGDWVFPHLEAEESLPSLRIEVVSALQAPPDQAIAHYQDQFVREVKSRLLDLGARVVVTSQASLDSRARRGTPGRSTPPVAAAPTYTLKISFRADSEHARLHIHPELVLDEPESSFPQGFVGPDHVAKVHPPLARFPRLLISARLAQMDDRAGNRSVGWFDEVEQFRDRHEALFAFDGTGDEVYQGAESVAFRGLLSNESTRYPVADILPGSLAWLEQDELKQELPFDEYVAWRVARDACLPSSRMVPGGPNAPAVIWLGSSPLASLGIAEETPLFVLTSGVAERINGQTWMDAAHRGLLVDARLPYRMKASEEVVIGAPPLRVPRILFLATSTDARRVQPIFGGLGSRIGQDAEKRLQLERWGKLFNDQIVGHLADLKIDVVTDEELQHLSNSNVIGRDGHIMAGGLEHFRKLATHVVHTHVRFEQRVDTALFSVTVSRFSDDGPRIIVQEEALVSVEELFPSLRRQYRRPPYLYKGHIVREEIEGRARVAQVIAEQNGKALIKYLYDRSFALRPVSSIGTGSHNDMIHDYAVAVARSICPRAGSVIDVPAPGTAIIDLGSDDGLGSLARLRVARLAEQPTLDNDVLIDEVPIAQVRVQSRRAGTSIVTVPPGVTVKPGDLVYPERRRGHVTIPRNPERVHVVVLPPIPDVSRAGHPSHIIFCVQAARAIANDLVDALKLFNIPLIVNRDLFEALQQQSQAGLPGSDVNASVGRVLGATHVITGTLTPVSNSRAIVHLILIDIETGEQFPLGSARAYARNVTNR